MEALLEREGQVENWKDDRLDELSHTMKESFTKSDRETKEGFARVDREMKEGFARVDREMKEGFGRVDREMKEGFAKVEEGFARIDRKLDQLPTREEVDHRFEAVHRETNQRFEATDRRIERVSTRFEHMVWATVAVAGGFFGNLFADKL